MSESQFAEALHAALEEETAGLTARPDAAHLARRQGRRRKATRTLMATVPAVALAVGGAVLVAHSTGTGTSSPAATHPVVLTADYVKKKVEDTVTCYSFVFKSATSHETDQSAAKNMTVSEEAKVASMSNPSLLKQELATDQATIKGKDVIDGQSVIDLHVRDADSTMDFWVNTQTFQPVKFVLNTSGQTITMVPTRVSCEVSSK